MCTVTYIPQKEGWMLTNNRDETPVRASFHLIKKETGGSRLLYPPDEKGGTWIAMSTPGRAICLLNGAFTKHAHRPPYRFSRGILVLAAVRAQNKAEFVENIDLEGVEPFTLIWKDDNTFFSLVWDGKESHIQDLNPAQNYIWSSSTLYTDEQKDRRNKYFQNFISKELLTPTKLREFHLSKPFGEASSDFQMERPGVKTIAVTQVLRARDSFTMEYLNLMDGSTLVSELSS